MGRNLSLISTSAHDVLRDNYYALLVHDLLYRKPVVAIRMQLNTLLSFVTSPQSHLATAWWPPAEPSGCLHRSSAMLCCLRTWLPVPGRPSAGSSSSRCLRMSSWKLCHRAATVSYSRVIPRTSSSFRLRLLLHGRRSSNPCNGC